MKLTIKRTLGKMFPLMKEKLIPMPPRVTTQGVWLTANFPVAITKNKFTGKPYVAKDLNFGSILVMVSSFNVVGTPPLPDPPKDKGSKGQLVQ